MPGSNSTATSSMRWPISRARVAAAIVFGFFSTGFARAGDDQPAHDVLAKGADLFAKEWLPVASKGPGGDGLGPVYNETSCIACHHQGGPGGAGPTSTNVEILTAGPPRNGLIAAAFHPAYVRLLPTPTDTRPPGSRESKSVTEGRTLFEAAGCAACHRARLGGIDGIYSDLLLHDMGSLLDDSGSYSGIAPRSPIAAVKRQEWRTPPLWGYRDSGPYLHDGRAENLEEAVALHGGEASNSAKRFFKLSPKERLRVQTFLRSLPPPRAKAR
jgi:CxxC motif-containing protein (DUF1111 family)